MNGTVLRVRDHILRRGLRVYLRPRQSIPLVRLGSRYGGWWVPSDLVRPGAVAYCAGAGEDITFDLELLKAGVHVTTFDPTPRAIEYVENLSPSGPFRFEPVGWWDQESELKFFAPRDATHVSHSVVNLQETSEYFTAKVASVRAIQERLGDASIDIIKMDIEGAEYRVIESLLKVGPRPKALCVEFDQPQPVRRTLRAIQQLEGAGLVLRMIEGWNYTFVSEAHLASGPDPR